MRSVPIAEFSLLINHPGGALAHFSGEDARDIAGQVRETAASVVREQSQGELVVLSVRVEHGCLTIAVVLGLAATPTGTLTAAGIVTALFAFLTKYKSLKDGVRELSQDVAKTYNARHKLKATPFSSRAPDITPSRPRPPSPAADLREWVIRELSKDGPAHVRAVKWLHSRNPPVTSDPLIWAIDAKTDEAELKHLVAAARDARN